MNTFLRNAVVTSALTAVFLTGCRVGPKYQKPPAIAQAPPVSYKESPTQFPSSDGWKVAQPQDAMLHGKWWEIYNDSELNSLEDKLNIDNQNIKRFFENFMEARTLVAQARSQLYPTVGFGPSYQRSQPSANVGSSTGASTSKSQTN
jgi:outer membrane protein TolC